MARRRKATSGVGLIDRGRITLNPDHHLVVRAWVLTKMKQLERSMDVLKAQKSALKTDKLDGQIDYFASVTAWLRGIYRGNTRSLEADEFEAAWSEVCATDFTGSKRANPDQPTIPGMG